jgi:hypothetical protein
MVAMGHGNRNNVKILEKIARWVSRTDLKSEDPAKMTQLNI